MQKFYRKLYFLLVSLCLSFVLLIFFLFPLNNNYVVLSCKGYEDEILSELIATLIEETTEYKVKRKNNLGSTFITFNALFSSDIDLYPEYSGTLLFGILQQNKLHKNPMTFIKNQLLEKYQLKAKKVFGFTNNYVVLITKEFQEKKGIYSLSDLQKFQENHLLRYGMDAEFVAREEFNILKAKYCLNLQPTIMDTGLLYLNLDQNTFDCIVGNELDDEISRFDLQILIDDKYRLPSYDSMIVFKEDLFSRFPKLKGVFKSLKNQISKEEFKQLNAILRKPNVNIQIIAKEFLKKKGLIKTNGA